MQWVRGMLVVLWCMAGAAVAQETPDARLREAQTAFDEAHTRWDKGQYADAIAWGEQSLALREAVLGGTHPDVALSLVLLGSHHLRQGNPVRAEPLLQRALAIQEAALGPNHPEVARTLTHLATLYLPQALYDRAEPLLLRAIAIGEATLGENHPRVAESLHHLANLYTAQRLYARAEPLHVRALAIREAALGKNHPEVAQTLHDRAHFFDLQGLLGRAEPLASRALAIREAALGQDHPVVADSLQLLIGIYRQQGAYTRAEPLLQRAVAIREAALGKNPPDLAAAFHQFADLYLSVKWTARAEPLLQRAVAIREAALGKNHPLVAGPLSWLGYFYFLQGLYDRAEPILERAVAIREAALGENHPLVADVLLDLGGLHEAQGLYARAETSFQRALAIRRAAFGEDSRFVATVLLDLGTLYMAQGLYARAEPLLRRGLAIEEATFGENHTFVARTLCLFGDFYVAQGLYARAEPLLWRALRIQEATGGRDHEAVAFPLRKLADLYAAQGLYGRARPLYERALAIIETTLNPSHPDVAETLNHLAMVHLARHRLTKALPLLTRAFTTSEQRLRQEALGFSEENLARFLQYLRADEERLYALLRAHPDDARVRRLALSAALLLKGRSVEESSDISRTVYQSLSARDRGTFERLRGLRTQLAQLSLQGPGSLPRRAYQDRLEELSSQGAALEADLARRSAPLRALAALPPPAEIVDRVAAALPKDAALVEFITYVDRPLGPKPDARRPGALRYLALVLFQDGTIRFRDLGAAEPLDAAVSRLRDALANRDADFQALAQALHQLAFQPLLPLLGNTRRLFLAPDGQLALVPFAALHDGQRFLVDAFDFTYLPSGKHLLPRPQESDPPGSVVVLADPDFNARLPALAASTGEASEPAWRSPRNARILSTLRADLAQRAWAPVPLPGTRQEAEAIQRLLPQAQLFMGPEATKERLLQLPPPGILHLATHGFFLEDAAPAPPDSRAVAHFDAMGEDTRTSMPPDPLLRSGLVFAGASAPEPSDPTLSSASAEHALVTALELASLNLWGTQLGELRRTHPHPHHWAPFLAMGRETPLRLPASPSQQSGNVTFPESQKAAP